MTTETCHLISVSQTLRDSSIQVSSLLSCQSDWESQSFRLAGMPAIDKDDSFSGWKAVYALAGTTVAPSIEVVLCHICLQHEQVLSQPILTQSQMLLLLFELFLQQQSKPSRAWSLLKQNGMADKADIKLLPKRPGSFIIVRQFRDRKRTSALITGSG